jgi:hypothetical protein
MKRTSDKGMKSLRNDGSWTKQSNAVGRFKTSEVFSWTPRFSFKRPSYVERQVFVKCPTVWSGIASVATPFAKTNFQRPSSIHPQVSTWTALGQDWDTVGLDMWKAMDAFVSQHPESFPIQGQLFDSEGVREVS